MPGKIAQCGAKSRLSLASKRMRPQVGMSGGKPRPEEGQRRLRDDGGGHVDGAGHDHRAQRVGQDVADAPGGAARRPRPRAASTNSFSRSDRNWARTSRATGIQRRPPMTATIRMKTPSLRAERLLQRVAEQVDDQQQQRELGQGQEEVGDAHQRVVDRAAEVPGDRADARCRW